MANFETVEVSTDLLILGGGFSACGAATEAAYWAKKSGLKVALVDKAALDRSGAVAMGLSAINQYVGVKDGENTLEDLEKIPPERISLIHFHDAADLPRDMLGDEDRLYPGEGVIDLGGFCRVLKNKGYEGSLSVELINPKLWETKSPKDMARKAWDSLKNYL